MKQNSILAVLAHPDDESFGMGGTLALYAQKGWDVYLVCATRGEAGEVRPEHLAGFASIAELRESELLCAAAKLGLKKVFFLGFRDSGMPGSPDNQNPDAQISHSIDEVAGKVVAYIRELRPNVVLTFDPIGGYRHPDHIHIHQATVLAFERAGDPAFHPESGAVFQPASLYFQVLPHTFLRLMVKLMPLFGKNPHKFGRNGDIDMQAIAEIHFPTHVKIDIRTILDKKEAAGSCHSSQGGPLFARGIAGYFIKRLGGIEEYMQAQPPVQPGWKVADDFIS